MFEVSYLSGKVLKQILPAGNQDSVTLTCFFHVLLLCVAVWSSNHYLSYSLFLSQAMVSIQTWCQSPSIGGMLATNMDNPTRAMPFVIGDYMGLRMLPGLKGSAVATKFMPQYPGASRTAG